MTGQLPDSASLVGEASRLAEETLRPTARDVDEQQRFPSESIEAIRAARLLGFFAPPDLGGVGGDAVTFARIASALGAACLSSALTWVMHAHQLATLVDHHEARHVRHIERITGEGLLLASVTSEAGKGGDVLRADAPLAEEAGLLRLRREAPVVSYGEQASYYLVTMRASAASPPNDVALVLVARDDGPIEVTGTWNALGMRGTCSVPMSFDVLVDPERLVGSDFRHVALQSLIPLAHIGWSAAWLGCARDALDSFSRRVRRSRLSALRSDRFLAAIAELRIPLDLAYALLDQVAHRVDDLRRRAAPHSAYEDATHNIALNNLKIAASRASFEVVDGLIEIAGMATGYLVGDDLALERRLRDLRSASLMYSNERLLQANGRLMVVEDTPSPVWSRQSVTRGLRSARF